MSSTDRQNRLLLTEDWKRVYQSFRNADFKSYDFDNLRRTMIQYLRENYPEDFNDYVESSEYLALIDLISFLGQNIAFRIDLNARENYLELAERKESVLRLARLLSYNPNRNIASNGLLKIDSVRTSEDLVDSNNVNLQSQTILWNDPSNENWYEQFIKVINSCLPNNGTFGRPVKREILSNIVTEQYRTNSINDTSVPIFKFDKVIDGKSYPFEVVSSNITDLGYGEESPFVGNKFSFLFRDDGKGLSSNNYGFFCSFVQGTLDEGLFTIENPSSNQSIAIETPNINNSDIWLYSIDAEGVEQDLWTKVDAIEGNNIIYNNTDKSARNIYSALSRVDDRVSLIFSDGVFGNLPKGSFKVYYRVSANQDLRILPNDFTQIQIQIPYLSKLGKVETITMVMSLKYSVSNGSTSESIDSIKFNAPATYYTQNRMVTGEDYQLSPLSVNQDIIKTKAINRTSSGISRYFDLVDATGKYSQTTLNGNDGVLYKEYNSLVEGFSFTSKTDVEAVVENTVLPILKNTKVRNFYFDKFPRIDTADLNINWAQTTNETNLSTGFFKNIDGVPLFLGRFTSSIARLIVAGTMLKFTAPTGYYFDKNNNIISGTPSMYGDKYYKWVKVISIDGKGIDAREDGTGAVYLNDVIQSGSVLSEIKPSLSNDLEDSVKQQVIDQIFANKTFGLRFDQNNAEFKLVTENNIDIINEFSTGKTGDTTNQQLDSSWLLLFVSDGESYTITYRTMRYVFESDSEIRFFYDNEDKIYNNLTGKIVKDRITVLNINHQPNSTSSLTQDFEWEISSPYRDAEGYVDSKKIEVTYYDDDEDGVVDDADMFEEIVSPLTNVTSKYVIFERIVSNDGVEDFNYLNNDNNTVIILNSKSEVRPFSEYADGQIFYYIDTDVFEILDQTSLSLSITANYKARLGRSNLKFRYIHAASSNVRIDPSASNIIDLYLLNKTYDINYRLWLSGDLNNKPLPPSNDELFFKYNTDLSKIKSLTDEIVYHPVKYKVLFGSKAEDDLKASFKIVKNKEKVLNDNEIKAKVLTAINQFFALENWDFGETFYFSELANYVMSELTPDIVTFIIVPRQKSQTFGSLYEIKSESDEVFASGATVADLEIIDAVTASRLNSAGIVVTQSVQPNVGIQSSTFTDTATRISTNRGSSY